MKVAKFGILLAIAPAIIASLAMPWARSQPIAQQTSPTLEEAWPYDNNFVVYEWLRSDRSKLYSHALEVQLAGNKLSLYNTHLSEPLGQNVRCGGFGCDLATGSLVAALTFERQGNLFVVREASERASFLQGAKCKITAHILECTSTKSPPRSANFPGIFRFYIAD